MKSQTPNWFRILDHLDHFLRLFRWNQSFLLLLIFHTHRHYFPTRSFDHLMFSLLIISWFYWSADIMHNEAFWFLTVKCTIVWNARWHICQLWHYNPSPYGFLIFYIPLGEPYCMCLSLGILSGPPLFAQLFVSIMRQSLGRASGNTAARAAVCFGLRDATIPSVIKC